MPHVLELPPARDPQRAKGAEPGDWALRLSIWRSGHLSVLPKAKDAGRSHAGCYLRSAGSAKAPERGQAKGPALNVCRLLSPRGPPIPPPGLAPSARFLLPLRQPVLTRGARTVPSVAPHPTPRVEHEGSGCGTGPSPADGKMENELSCEVPGQRRRELKPSPGARKSRLCRQQVAEHRAPCGQADALAFAPLPSPSLAPSPPPNGRLRMGAAPGTLPRATEPEVTRSWGKRPGRRRDLAAERETGKCQGSAKPKCKNSISSLASTHQPWKQSPPGASPKAAAAGLRALGPAVLHVGSRSPEGPPAPVARARPPRGAPCASGRAGRVMDGSGAGGLSGLIDEVRADGRRVTRGGGRRAPGGGRTQTRRRSGSAPGRPPPPPGAPRPGSAEGAAGAEGPPRPGTRCAAPLPPRRRPASRPRLPAAAASPAEPPRSLGLRPDLRSYPAAADPAGVQARRPPSGRAPGRGAPAPAEGPRPARRDFAAARSVSNSTA
ncbi:collagen alpha-1(I) chain-like [Mesoplodon densirostris]|uniref:collagen alpha-1(I) chain-like n=1 Tax=Mesoplodon densirostris TaxID=48708 RepID=UPI0028DD37FB|nr:collagen alpha-1(I) chain-like [Mesoplodon densirostris]